MNARPTSQRVTFTWTDIATGTTSAVAYDVATAAVPFFSDPEMTAEEELEQLERYEVAIHHAIDKRTRCGGAAHLNDAEKALLSRLHYISELLGNVPEHTEQSAEKAARDPYPLRQE